MPAIANVKLGSCEIIFGSTNLGHTKNGVELSYEPMYHEVSVDLYGQTVVEKHLIGEKLTAVCTLAEYTMANLNVAMPFSTLAGSGNARITLGAKAGKKATTKTSQLVIKPLTSTGNENNIVFYKAFVDSVVTIPHKNDEERLVEVTFTALLDETKLDGNYLGLIGDSSL